VVEPLSQLAKHGLETHWLPVDSTGIVSELGLAASLPTNLRLVSVMLANNETGVIQPIAKLSTLLAGQSPFHCDAVQAVGRIPVSFRDLGVFIVEFERSQVLWAQGNWRALATSEDAPRTSDMGRTSTGRAPARHRTCGVGGRSCSRSGTGGGRDG